jgi:hypothetical protein
MVLHVIATKCYTVLVNVFLIGYGVVAGFNVVDYTSKVSNRLWSCGRVYLYCFRTERLGCTLALRSQFSPTLS